MLNEKQHEIFNRILDLNMKFNDSNKTSSERLNYLGKLVDAKCELRDDMGVDAYNNFMNMGTRLFAEKKSED